MSDLILNKLNIILNNLFFCRETDTSIEQGAATTVYACLAPALLRSYPGAYLADCGAGTVSPVLADPDGLLRDSLWAATEAQILLKLGAQPSVKGAI